MQSQPMQEMKKWQCHKKVHAEKIEKIILDIDLANKENRETDGSAYLFFEGTSKIEGYEGHKVEYEYVHKHKPEVGGYYVVYEGGYKSFSPAKEFEEGYTLIS